MNTFNKYNQAILVLKFEIEYLKTHKYRLCLIKLQALNDHETLLLVPKRFSHLGH